MRTVTPKIIAAAAAALLLLTGCTEESANNNALDAETESRHSGYVRAVERQPAKSMPYSNSRDTINFYASTWGEPGKLAYVYLMNGSGDLVGYFITEGRPVSWCASLTPTYDLKDAEGDGDSVADFQVPAPGIDHVYHSGNECNTYYGKDASTGAYVEYTVGYGLNPLIYDQPLPQNNNVRPLGDATVDNVK